MIPLLLDLSFPFSVVALLQERGHDAIHAGTAGLARANDTRVLDRARLDGRTLVSLDTRFQDLLTLQRRVRPSLILLETLPGGAGMIAEMLDAVCRAFEADLESGSFLRVAEERVFVRKLPFGVASERERGLVDEGLA